MPNIISFITRFTSSGLNGALRHPLWALATALIVLTGCRSKPPPAPAPPAEQQALSLARQAAKLSESENWPSAARQWQKAADQYALLNNPVGEAIALHNLAQAEREMGQFEEAQRRLEQAASLNRENNQTNAWWRNQIALLQIEALTRNDSALESHFMNLITPAGTLPWPELRGLFYNELGQWQGRQKQYQPALNSLATAEQAFQKADYPRGLAAVLANRAQLHLDQANYTAALNEWRQALDIYEALALPEGVSRTLLGLGETLLAAGQDLSTAEEHLRHAVRNFRTLGDSKNQLTAQRLLLACLEAQDKGSQSELPKLAQVLELEAARLAGQGQKAEAAGLWQESAKLWESLNNPTARDRALERLRELEKP